MSKKNELDQYYTNPDYAQHCFDQVMPMYDGGLFVEPCAGTGSFFKLMPKGNRLGMDLDPKFRAQGMKNNPQDFLEYSESLEGAFVVSNPPFGKNCSLAVSFFNKCAELGAGVIAFVIPRTFRKASMMNKLNNHYHKIHDEDSPKNSFILDGEPYDVPCCFQIWVRREQIRPEIPTVSENSIFEFVNKGEHTFVVRRAGGRAGKLIENEADPKESSNYFLRPLINEGRFRDLLLEIDLSQEAANTAGVKSIAKYELTNKVREAFYA